MHTLGDTLAILLVGVFYLLYILAWTAVPVGAFVLVVRYWRKERRRLEHVRAAIAETLGGSYRGGLIEFQIGDRAARLEFHPAKIGQQPCTMVSVDLRGHSPGALQVCRRESSPWFSGQSHETGDLEFDARYAVRATPPALVTAVFSPLKRAWLTTMIRGLEKLGEPAVDVGRERLIVRVHKALEDERWVRHLVNVASMMCEHLTDAVPAGVAWMESVQGEASRCMVCGTSIEAAVVRCERCRTPHHRDCWEFMGACSTFACGSKQRA